MKHEITFENLTELISTKFKLDNNIFNINVNEFEIKEEDGIIKTTIEFKLQNQYFKSYQYKTNKNEHWESVMLHIDTSQLNIILEILNKILLELNMKEIHIDKLK